MPQKKPILTFIFLLVSFLAFGLDLLHMIHHIFKEPVLLKIQGVPWRLLFKVFCFLIPAFLLIRRSHWLQWLLLIGAFSLRPAPRAFAFSNCEHARELLDRSGVARDADENLFGQIKLKPPTGSFPVDMDKITWWGDFKPFEFWESPEFQAVWINPRGEEAHKQNFRGTKCRLAKTSIQAEKLPKGEFEKGIWSVIVTCEDYLISKQNFALLPLQPDSSKVRTQEGRATSLRDEAVTIWAKDEVKG